MSKTNIEVIKSIANAMKLNFLYNNEKDVAREIVETKAMVKPAITPEAANFNVKELYPVRENTSVAVNSFKAFMEKSGLIK